MNQSGRSHSGRNRLNNQIMWPILIVLILAPFAFDSTKPSLRSLWSVILTASGAYLFAGMAFIDAHLRVPLRAVSLLAGLYIVSGIYMLVQVIPLGSLSPSFPVTTQGHVDVVVDTISLTPDDTLMAVMRWLSYGFLFFIVLQIAANQRRAQLFLKILFWSIVLHAVISLLFLLQFGDTILGIPKWKYFGDALGGFINRNSFATFLALGSVVGVNLILQSAGNRSKAGKSGARMGQDTIFIGIGLLILLVTLIATNSRMGAFAAICGIAFSLALVLTKKIEGGNGFRVWPFLGFLTAAVAFGALTYGSTLTERLGRADDDAAIRQKLYAQVIDMISLRPLVGYGGDSFEYVFPLFHRPPVSVDLVWSKTHSTYLALWSDYGLIFGTLPILLVAIAFFQLLGVHRRLAEPDALIRCGIGAIVVGAVHSLVDFSLEIEAVTFVFVAILAVACARQYELNNAKGREEVQ